VEVVPAVFVEIEFLDDVAAWVAAVVVGDEVLADEKPQPVTNDSKSDGFFAIEGLHAAGARLESICPTRFQKRTEAFKCGARLALNGRR